MMGRYLNMSRAVFRKKMLMMDAPNQNSDPLKTLQMIADSSSGQLRWSSNTLSSFLDAPIRNASLYKGLSVLPSVRWSVGLSVGRYVRYTALKTLFSALFCRGDENMKPNTIQYMGHYGFHFRFPRPGCQCK